MNYIKMMKHLYCFQLYINEQKFASDNFISVKLKYPIKYT